MKQFEQKEFTYTDASHIFLYAILMPQVLGLLFIFVVAFVAKLLGTTYDIAIDSIIAKSFMLFLAQIGFLIVFFSYQYAKKIDWVKATRIKNKINIKQIILIIVIACASLYLFLPLINLVDHLISLTGYSSSFDLPINLNTIGGAIIGIIALAVLPAIFEELIFRGVLFQGFLKKFGYKKAIIFSALLFALMHTSIQQTAYQIIIGVMLAYVFYITGSLLAPILLHFVNNFIVILLNIFVEAPAEPLEPIFTSFDDYMQVIIFTLVGTYIIWQLFKLLKVISHKQKFDNEQLGQTEQYMPKDIESVNTAQLLQPETTQITESMYVKTEQNNKTNFLIVSGIIIGILFWLMDLFTYLP